MTYTIINQQGEPVAQGLDAASAAHAILTYDSASYEIVRDGDWVLWTKRLNGRWAPTLIGSAEDDQADAEAAIFAEVVRVADTAHGWTAEAITDEQCAEMLAEMGADQ